MVTALILTDDGPNLGQQPSKLFSPRDEFQDMRAADIPDTFRSIPASEMRQSLTAVAHQIPVPLHKTKGKNVLLETQKEVRAALETLGAEFDTENLDEVADMRARLDAAGNVVNSAAASVKNLPGNVHLKELRAIVVSDIQVLDRHIDVVSARLPRVPEKPDNAPMRYNAGE